MPLSTRPIVAVARHRYQLLFVAIMSRECELRRVEVADARNVSKCLKNGRISPSAAFRRTKRTVFRTTRQSCQKA